MKFSTLIILPLSILCVPVNNRGKPSNRQSRTKSSTGAAYFMTNDPKGNSIVINRIQNDGKLAFSKTIQTQGNGAGGFDTNSNDTVGPDGLFSQDSVVVGNNFLFAANAGSNSISTFQINKYDPTKLQFLNVVPSGGDFPVALTFSSKLGMLCAANGGQVNGVMCFSATNAGLTPLDDTCRSLGLTQTTPPKGPLGTVSDILFDNESNNLLVSVKGNPPANVTGFIASFGVQGNKLAETPTMNVPKGSVAPFSMSLVPQTNSMMFTDAGVGFGIVNLNNGVETASTMVPIEGQGATCWSAFSQETKNVYMVDILTNLVTEASIDVQNTPSAKIVKQYPLSGNTIDFRIGTIKGKDFLYVLTPGELGAQVMSLNGPGQATVIQTFQPNEFKNFSKLIQGMALFIPN
ncbi:hypothetical protein HDV02_005033 [Globomyces sp. JEL0801]|nr:hypothetical protein HDV02_005033 [Globomyces sp. JEL0801]